MYVAINRFYVRPQYVEKFRERWLSRTVHIQGTKGFLSFQFGEGKLTTPDDGSEPYLVFASHTFWESEKAFIDWTSSPQYKAAHSRTTEIQGQMPKQEDVEEANLRANIFVQKPVFQGYEVLFNRLPPQAKEGTPLAVSSGYLATNNFLVKKGEEEAFEARWQSVGPHILPAKGLVSFQFLKAAANENTRKRLKELNRTLEEDQMGSLYVSETFWQSEADFIAWTESDLFKEGHKDVAKRRKLTLQHAIFEGLKIHQVVTNDRA